MLRLTFEELRTANLERVRDFGHDGLDGWNVAEWGNALAGETGELCNILKKFIRQAPGDPSPENLIRLAAEEVADVQIYLDLVAAKMGIDLAQATVNKFNKSSRRISSDTKLCRYPGCPNRNARPPCPTCYE